MRFVCCRHLHLVSPKVSWSGSQNRLLSLAQLIFFLRLPLPPFSCLRPGLQFWHSPVAKPRLQQQQRALSPDLPLPGLWGGDSGAAEPLGPPLRRNNSSSAVQRVDLTGLADAADAAAESEYDQQMQLALALSIQEQQQQQQPAGHSSGPAGGDASDDGDVPGLDDSLLPSWMQTDYMPAAAAAPPASPVNDSSPDAGSPAAPGPAAAACGEADADADLLSLTPAAATDGIFALTPPQDASPQQQQQQQQRADAMDLDQGLAASPVHGLFAGLAPASPVPQAPRQDRSGRVSSSIAPGGSQQLRPAAGQKLGGGLMATGAPNAAAAAAALQRLNASPNPVSGAFVRSTLSRWWLCSVKLFMDGQPVLSSCRPSHVIGRLPVTMLLLHSTPEGCVAWPALSCPCRPSRSCCRRSRQQGCQRRSRSNVP
jgi:hypothetical protein